MRKGKAMVKNNASSESQGKGESPTAKPPTPVPPPKPSPSFVDTLSESLKLGPTEKRDGK
jgi:hypothetical protein